MLQRVSRRLARRKHGQKAWSPNTTSSGAAPTNGVTAQEALQIAYRPMPPANTVEYEEDFGPSMIIHREFVSSKDRTRMSTDMAQLAYSDVELTKARQQLANVMNRERRGVLVGSAGEESDRVLLNAEVGETTREVRSARFLFNEPRMQFCDRFQTFFRDRIERQQHELQQDRDDSNESHYYFSLMEACAVLHGCTTADARETYYRRFLGLTLDALEAEDEALRARLADAEDVNRQLLASSPMKSGRETARDAQLKLAAAAAAVATGSQGGTHTAIKGGNAAPAEPMTRTTAAKPADVVQDIIDSLPPLFPGPESPVPSTTAAAESSAHKESAFPPRFDTSETTTTTSEEPTESLRDETSVAAAATLLRDDDVAPLYKAYLAHARGESPVSSYDATTIGAHAAHAERRRWRALMDKIAAEEYHHLTASELEDAYVLNQQLHTVKFFDLKVGDTVREIMQLLQRGTGVSTSGDRDVPLEASPSHPERRV